MHPSIEEKLPQIRELCRKYGVKKLELFGSAARDDFDPVRSDADFLVEFAEVANDNLADRYFGLLAELEELCDRPVDLATPSLLNEKPRLARRISHDRQAIFA